MSAIQRYALRADCTLDPMNADMEPDPAGGWVEYDDHAALVRDMAKLMAKMADALTSVAQMYEDSADMPAAERVSLFFGARCIARGALSGQEAA